MAQKDKNSVKDNVAGKTDKNVSREKLCEASSKQGKRDRVSVRTNSSATGGLKPSRAERTNNKSLCSG